MPYIFLIIISYIPSFKGPVQYPNKADLTKYLADNKYVLSSSYTFGNDAYKDTFTITDPSGNVVGQHGIEMAPSINTPKQVQ